MYLNILLKHLHFVFTSIARKYVVFVLNHLITTVFVFKYIWRVFCPSLLPFVVKEILRLQTCCAIADSKSQQAFLHKLIELNFTVAKSEVYKAFNLPIILIKGLYKLT